jgi:PBP1b-binding outer membrane lipoprotein LpoB
MKKVLFLALIAVATLASCKNNNATTENTNTNTDTTSVYVDSTLVDSVSVDTTIQPVQPTEPIQNDQITPAVR